MSLLRVYISGHGLGHASRCSQVIQTLRLRHPALRVEVVSTAPPWFLQSALPHGVPVARRPLDVGVLQADSLIMDEAATLRACRAWLTGREAWLAAEVASLVAAQVKLVLADIPPLPLVAAARAGLPGVGLSNFSWDWIYQGFADRQPEFAAVADAFQADYAQAELLLRLPFYGEFPGFSRIEDVPLVARHATVPAAEVRQRLGIEPHRRVGLISFGGFGLREFDFRALARIDGWVFLTEAGLAAELPNVRVVPPGSLAYPDLVGAADVVITKPGYGIVSECIANRTAVLYTPRGDFREQPLLVAGLERYTRAREIDNLRLRSGDWEDALAALLGQPEPVEQLAGDGAAVVADRLAALVAGT